MSTGPQVFDDMTARSREVFRRVVEAYLDHGDPVGSRTLARLLDERVSAATVRNAMQDLEYLGLLDSPHASAGRVPTELGLRFFIDGLLETTTLEEDERQALESSAQGCQEGMKVALARVSHALSVMTRGAALVLAPKREAEVKHIEFVSLSADRALAVLVFADGQVENRIFTPPPGQTPFSMREAANFLNGMMAGKTLAEIRNSISRVIDARRNEIDRIARQLVDAEVAIWDNSRKDGARLIVRGRANLLETSHGEVDVDRIKLLFDDLERKQDIAEFLTLTEGGDGVKVFIGSENKLFSLSGSSLIVAPYKDSNHEIIGAVGVIGPTRLNYGRIVPIVEYTAQMLGRLIDEKP